MIDKGIILAGGSSTRLYPLTCVTSKQLLPVYDKPMIYYPLSTLMLAGIRDILIITTPADQHLLEGLLGDGSQFGIQLGYAIQQASEGPAQAFIIGEDFIAGSGCALILGDNIFHGPELGKLLRQAAARRTGATIFAYEVADPESYGAIALDTDGHARGIEDTPDTPTSSSAVTGLYFYDERIVDMAKAVRRSPRGGHEITQINELYSGTGSLHLEKLGRGFASLDTGTFESLHEACDYVATIERRQGLKIACPEEIALRMGFLTTSDIAKSMSRLGSGPYANYVSALVEGRDGAPQ